MRAIVALVVLAATPTFAQQMIVVPSETRVALATTVDLTSKKSRKGDPVPLETVEDIVVGGSVAIPKGAQGMGEIGDMRAKGAMGQRGKLSMRPLYIVFRGRTIRLKGEPAAATGRVEPGAVLGLAAVSPLFTGKSAVIPAGTVFETTLLRDTEVTP